MMPKINRLTGRFFTVLISLSVAFLLPRAAVAGEAGPRSPVASPAAAEVVPGVRADLLSTHPFAPVEDGTATLNLAGPLFAEWPTEHRFTPFRLERQTPVLVASVASLPSRTSPANLLVAPAGGPAPTLCQISDTVYRADGSPAQGTVLLTWQAFTTAAGQSVTPGSLLVTLDVNGGFNASVAPNTGASPAGTYYKAIFKLSDGTTETEYWVVPNTQTTTIGAIRSKLVPANQAAQFLTRDFADSNYVNLNTTETVAGIKTFSSSPAVPTPVNPTDAANKAYVDANAGSGNLASPPPIGNVTPNSVAATSLAAQNVIGVLSAASYSGADWSVAANAAITAAPSGGTVSLLGFTATQLAAAGSVTVAANKPVKLLMPPGTLIFNGNPGISVTASNVTIECVSSKAYSTPTTSPTVLQSGAAAPLISVINSSMHQADGFAIRNCELNGNSLGTFGIFAPESYTTKLSGLLVRNFTAAGIFDLAGQADISNTLAVSNGGDGYVLGYDGHVSGMTQSDANQGDGWHLIAGGYVFDGPTCYQNGLHGMHLDANNGGDWVASATYVEPKIILPTSNNAGNYAFYSQQVGASSSSRPAFCQSMGCLTSDGGVTWINIGTGSEYGLYSMFNAPAATNINSFNCGASNFGNHAGDWDNLFIEGTPTKYQWHISVIGSQLDENQVGNPPAHGMHMKFVTLSSVKGTTWYGGGSQPDLGGLKLENTYVSQIDDFSCYYSYAPCAALVSSQNITLDKVLAQDGGASGDPVANTYALTLDAGSNALVEGILAIDNRGTPYQRGISNAGANNLTVKNQRYAGLAASPDSGSYSSESFAANGWFNYNVPTGAQYQWNVNGSPMLGVGAGGLTYQNITGVNYLVSHYASIQAAINAAYNNGSVFGTVIDDRTAPYSGPGFILYDSVTLQLAATTYTITSTVSYNNGNNNVTAGIIAIPGARLIGAGTSTNHGTIITAGNGLNADLIATSTVGTGIGAAAQWWHWGELSNLRFLGNGANQTAGDCVKIENLGETARVRDIELSGCKANNLEFIGASATQSAVTNITSNQSVSGSGVAFTALAGVGVLNGISGDCNNVALINANFAASGTLEIHGLKAEAESSICPSQVQDPVILSSTTDSNALASVRLDGGYAFGTSQVNFLKSTGPGTIQFLMTNFYLTGYTNILNDTVRGQVIANAPATTKQPVSYLSNGWVFGNQAFTFQPNTFMQANPNGTPTEMFGAGSDSSTDIAAIGNGDNTKYSAGGLKFGTFNRTQFGQTPEYQVRMGWRWTNPGYDTTTWTFIPIWGTGDNSARWIGDPNVRWPEVYAADVNSTTATVGTLNVTTCNGCGGSFQQVNSDWNATSGVAQILNKPSLATVATSGSYNDLSNKPVIPVQGAHLVSGTMQGNTATLTGNSADQTIYAATLPAGTFTVGTGAHCWAKWQHAVSGSTAITYKWTLGSATVAYAAFTSASINLTSDIEVLTPASLSSQIINASPAIAGTAIQAGPSNGNAGSENLANADTIKFTFNAGSGEQVKGISFYCQTVQ